MGGPDGLPDAGLDLPNFLRPAVELVQPTSPWEKTYEFRVWKQDLKFKPVDFKIEAACFVVALLFLLFHVIGKARNRAFTKAWLQVAMPLLEDEFAFVGKEEEGEGHHLGQGEGQARVVWNGGSEALAYASGRRGVDG